MIPVILTMLRSHLDAVVSSDDGYSTAELLANAALAIGALVTIWAAMGGLGTNVITWIESQLTT